MHSLPKRLYLVLLIPHIIITPTHAIYIHLNTTQICCYFVVNTLLNLQSFFNYCLSLIIIIQAISNVILLGISYYLFFKTVGRSMLVNSVMEFELNVVYYFKKSHNITFWLALSHVSKGSEVFSVWILPRIIHVISTGISRLSEVTALIHSPNNYQTFILWKCFRLTENTIVYWQNSSLLGDQVGVVIRDFRWINFYISFDILLTKVVLFVYQGILLRVVLLY